MNLEIIATIAFRVYFTQKAYDFFYMEVKGGAPKIIFLLRNIY